MTRRTGQCLCGAVRFAAAATGGFGVCHCGICRRWTGGPLFAVTVKVADMTIEGAGAVRATRTSAMATRCRCADCGSPLWYRYDKGQDGTGDYEVPVGLLDDASGLTIGREIFIDGAADGIALRGDHPRLTETERMALRRAEERGDRP